MTLIKQQSFSGHARHYFAHVSARWHRPRQDKSSRDKIAICNETAKRTRVNTNSKRLANLRPAQTSLRSAPSVDFYEQPTSFFRFVGQHLKKARPRHVVYRLREFVVSYHSSDIQVFDYDQPVRVYDLPRLLVMKIAALIADMVRPTTKKENGFSPAIRSLLATRHATVKASKFRLGRSEETRVYNLNSVAKSCESVETNVDANDLAAKRQGADLTVNSKQGKPAGTFALHSQGLNGPLKRSVQFDAYTPHLGDPHLATLNHIAYFTKRHAVISGNLAVTGIASLLVVLKATKESIISQMDAMQNVFQHLRVHAAYIGSLLADLAQLTILIEPRDRLAFALPRVAALKQGRIVKFAAQSELIVEDLFLRFRGVDPITECFDHRGLFYQMDFRVRTAKEV